MPIFGADKFPLTKEAYVYLPNSGLFTSRTKHPKVN